MRQSKPTKRLLVAILIGISCMCNAQVNVDSIVLKYRFLNSDSAHLRNAEALWGFYKKLYRIERRDKGIVNVVHIGDSHIQADFFSGKVRQQLQDYFGNAGRGIIFPYRLAKSNEPASCKITSNVTWRYKRNVYKDPDFPMGICGYNLQTTDTNAEIRIKLRPQNKLNYSVKTFTLFQEKSDESFDFIVLDSNRNTIGEIQSMEAQNHHFTSNVTFKEPVSNFILKVKRNDSLQRSTKIYGMLATNDSIGVRYHAIGVNGAEYKHFTQSVYFQEQLKVLEPDLIIISMGTNEGFNYHNFSIPKFYTQVDSFIKSIQAYNPGVAIMLTTPPDSYRKSRKSKTKNPTIKQVRNTLVACAQNNNLAWWDLYEAGGGYGAMAKWQAKGMSDKARVHFTKKGYELQGDLLYHAIMEGYSKYIDSVRR